MIALLCFVLNVLVSPFKSTSRLEVENAALRQQLVVLQRKVRGAGARLVAWYRASSMRWREFAHMRRIKRQRPIGPTN